MHPHELQILYSLSLSFSVHFLTIWPSGNFYIIRHTLYTAIFAAVFIIRPSKPKRIIRSDQGFSCQIVTSKVSSALFMLLFGVVISRFVFPMEFVWDCREMLRQIRKPKGKRFWSHNLLILKPHYQFIQYTFALLIYRCRSAAAV